MGDRGAELRVWPVGRRELQAPDQGSDAGRGDRGRAISGARQDRCRRDGRGAFAAANPDGIFNVLFGADLLPFVREGNTRGLFKGKTVVSLLSGEPEYMLPLKDETPEGWIVTGYPWDQITDPAHKAFVEAYRAKFNDTPRLGSLLGYVVAYMVRDVINKAGSTETDKLIAALADMKFDTISGPVLMRGLDRQSTLGAWVGETRGQGGAGRHGQLEVHRWRGRHVQRSRSEGRAEEVNATPWTVLGGPAAMPGLFQLHCGACTARIRFRWLREVGQSAVEWGRNHTQEERAMTQTFGMAGIGAMGLRMITRARAAEVDVVVFDLNPAALAAATALGATTVPSARALADAAETIFASLPLPSVSEAVALGSDGLVHGRAIKHYIDLSTTGAPMAKKIADALSARQIACLDAPVSGGPAGVDAGTLAVMTSGSRSAFDACQPFLVTFARKITYIGPDVGQAQVVKLANNLLAATNSVVLAEVSAMAAKAGVDLDTLLDVINASSGRSWISEVAYPKHVATGTWDQGFRIELMHKDVSLCLQQADAGGTPMWVGAAVRQFYQFLMTQGLGTEDLSRIAALEAQWAGITLPDRRVKTD